MLRSFVLLDEDRRDIEFGTLSYDTELKRFSMEINHVHSSVLLPLSLAIYAENGKYKLEHDDSLRWVKARICPPSRHNIREILTACGLQEYDEFGILMYTMGHSDKDELYLKEI